MHSFAVVKLTIVTAAVLNQNNFQPIHLVKGGKGENWSDSTASNKGLLPLDQLPAGLQQWLVDNPGGHEQEVPVRLQAQALLVDTRMR